MAEYKLFIPKRIRVGYQTRGQTYTGRLAYVIYYDAKGKLRKEVSWTGWRDEKIAPEEFDNVPTDGFHLNKDIQRYNWSHFGSNRSYIRIFDSRGIEFEVTPENLIGILTETDCLKRGLDGKFVYAWHGPELVLLPCCSQAYKEAMVHTDRQGKKISARDLKEGCSYTTKQGDEVIYLGRFTWFTWDRYAKKTRVSQKKHIFVHAKKPKYGGCKFFPRDASFLAELNSDEAVQNYPALIEEFNGDIHSAVFEKWETRPLKPTNQVFAMTNKPGIQPSLCRDEFTSMDGDVITFWWLQRIRKGNYYGGGTDEVRGHRLRKRGTLNTKTLVYERDANDRSQYGYYGYNRDYRDTYPVSTEQEVLDELANFVEINIVLSSGKKLSLRNIDKIRVK